MRLLHQRRPNRADKLHPEHLRLREELMDLLLRVIEDDRLGQCTLCHIFRITQPRASDLAHRRIERFNSETLVDMLARVGVRLKITVSSRDQYRRWEFGEAAKRASPGRGRSAVQNGATFIVHDGLFPNEKHSE